MGKNLWIPDSGDANKNDEGKLKRSIHVQNDAVPHSTVFHPSHYCDGGIETIDYILAKKMDFLLGQVCKYISRAGKKDPARELEDLQKARFYLDKKIQLLVEAEYQENDDQIQDGRYWDDKYWDDEYDSDEEDEYDPDEDDEMMSTSWEDEEEKQS